MESSSTSSGPSRHHLLTAEEKTACISLRSAGWKLPKIAAHLGLNYDTIYKKRLDSKMMVCQPVQLLESMPRRMEAVIKAKGGQTSF